MPTEVSAYSRHGKLQNNFIVWQIQASSFPDPNDARLYITSAARTWQTYGGADIALLFLSGEPAAADVGVISNDLSVIFYDANHPKCAGGKIAYAGWVYNAAEEIDECDIVICEWDTWRGADSYGPAVIAHEMGHCIGFHHSSGSVMGANVPHQYTNLSEDDVAGLYDPQYGYARQECSIETEYSSTGTSWTLHSTQAGGVSNASFRKTDVAGDSESNRYAIAYSDSQDNLRVMVSDGNNVVDSNVDTGGNTFSGPGIAWKADSDHLVVVYRAKNSYLYSRSSTDRGASWGSWVTVGGLVGATVDVAWSPVANRFYAVAENGLSGLVEVYWVQIPK